MNRQSLLGQAEAKYEYERMLKSSALTITNGQTHQPSAAPDDLVIEIEVGPGYAASSTTQLLEERNESLTTEEEPHVTIKPARQAAATENFELEVSVYRYLVNQHSYYKLNNYVHYRY